MAKTNPLQTSYQRMVRDVPRHQLGDGDAWNMVDFIPNELLASLGKRGGWTQASPDLSTVASGATYCSYAGQFGLGSTLLLAWTDNRKLVQVASSVSAATASSAQSSDPSGIPFVHAGEVVFGDSTNGVYLYNGSSLRSASGGAPSTDYYTVYADRTVLARSVANTNRIWFSAGGNPASYDTSATGRWIDTSFRINGVAALRNSLLVFSPNAIERIRGDIPPPGGNMVLEKIADVGTLANRTFAFLGDSLVFASPDGVFITSGGEPVNLLQRGRMLSYYLDTVLKGASASIALAGGIYRGIYYLSIMDGAVFRDALCCNLRTREWWRMSNLKSGGFGRSLGSIDPELYFGSRTSPIVGSISSVHRPTNAVRDDGDGTPVSPVLETRFTPLTPRKRIRSVFIGNDLRDEAGLVPTLTVSYTTSPESSAYTALTPTIAPSSAYQRTKLPVRAMANGIGLKVAQTGRSASTRIFDLELELHRQEPSR